MTMPPVTSPIAPPEVGEIAPDFTVPDANDESRRLSDLCVDRPLLLVFYRGHW